MVFQKICCFDNWRRVVSASLLLLGWLVIVGEGLVFPASNFESLADDIYFSLVKLQSLDGSGIIADEKDRCCQSAAQAFAAMALIERGHFNRARRILDFFENIYRCDVMSEDGFRGFADFYEIKSAMPYSAYETGLSSSVVKDAIKISPFATASISVAMLNYRLATNDKRFDSIINSLADYYLKNLNIWGLYQNKDISNKNVGIKLAPNLAAYTVFCCAALIEKISRQEGSFWARMRSMVVGKKGVNPLKPMDKDIEYLKALKRLRFALFEMFYDEKRKVFRDSWREDATFGSEADNFFAWLVFGKNAFPYEVVGLRNTLNAEETIRNNGVLKSCFAALISSAAYITSDGISIKKLVDDYVGRLILQEGGASQNFIIKSRSDERIFFIDKNNAPNLSYDILTTAVYLLALQGKNPFDVISSAIDKDNGIIYEEFSSIKIERGEKWSGDTFENGEEEFYMVETSLVKNAEIPSPPVGIFADEKIKKEGNFSLKFRFITKQTSGDKSQGAVSRFFYPEQDFLSSGNTSSVKCWISARPATFTLGVTNLRIRLRLTDAAGASADSKNLNYSGRGVENTLPFPSGFTPTSPLKVPDYTRIKKISFVLEEDTQTTWDINVDNLKLE